MADLAVYGGKHTGPYAIDRELDEIEHAAGQREPVVAVAALKIDIERLKEIRAKIDCQRIVRSSTGHPDIVDFCGIPLRNEEARPVVVNLDRLDQVVIAQAVVSAAITDHVHRKGHDIGRQQITGLKRLEREPG
ncbi:hypothetical protein D9M72_450200 [compost metagenome]